MKYTHDLDESLIPSANRMLREAGLAPLRIAGEIIEFPSGTKKAAVKAALDGLVERAERENRDDAIADAKSRIKSRIDALGDMLTARYTKTEQKGWSGTMLPEARKYLETERESDAPGLALQSAMTGVSLEDTARGVVTASTVTGLIPSIASGARSRAEAMLEATDASEEQIEAVLALLDKKGLQILSAAASGDRDGLMLAATEGWSVL